MIMISGSLDEHYESMCDQRLLRDTGLVYYAINGMYVGTRFL